MKFTIVSHACLYVQSHGGAILVDPWIIGTCYWRSWWNFPEPSPVLLAGLRPDCIYITHLHWDHFHGPSLRRFDRRTRILVPKCPTRRMVVDLDGLGFTDIQEVPHGDGVELWPGFRLHSYQFGPFFSDSAMVLTDGETTILDLNDCKLFGLPMSQLTRTFPKIDFCLRSHSSASPLPYCVKDYKNKFPELRSQQNYIDEFINCCLSIGARYAIPFASNHCFVHRETLPYNDTVVDPAMVERQYNARAAALGRESQCVVMPPGSTWERDKGFDIVPFDYGKKQEYLESLLSRYEAKLQRQYEIEDRTRASFSAFERYFTRMMGAMPALLRKRFMPRVQFKVVEHDVVHYWLADFPGRLVAKVNGPVEADFTIEVHAIVLNDCTRKRMFSSWAAAKRLRILLDEDADDLGQVGTLLGALDFYENDGFPLRNNFSRRQLGVRLRRWREAVEAVRLGVRHKVLRRPMVVSELYPVGPARA